MNVLLDPKLTIQKAASRVRGDRLVRLYMLCEQQRTISTRKLRTMLDDLALSDRQDGIHFRALAEFVRKHSGGD